MKRKSKVIPVVIAAAIMALLAFLFRGDTGSASSVSEEGTVTVSVTMNDEAAGKMTIAVKEGDTYTDTGLTSITVPEGTKTKMWFADGMNENYEVVFWTAEVDGTMNYVYSNTEGGEIYTEKQFVKTVKQNTHVYFHAVPKGAVYHTVEFYDSGVKGKRNLVGAAAVVDGQKAYDTCVISQRKMGFDQNGWSLSLEHVTEDMEVYPVYRSNIYTMFRDYKKQFMHGLLVTLLLSVISVALAMVLGVIICLIRLSGNRFFGAVVTAYVEVIRGVPLLLQLLLIYVLLGPTKISFGSFFTTEVLSCILTLTINSSAYSSEIFRSGIQAVDAGQMEAGRALGMSSWQVMKKVVIPQGIRNALPSIVNELVQMIKETSLAVSVDASIGELMSVRKNITAATYVNLPPYIIVAIIYFCVTFSLSKCVGLLERRLAERG